MLALLVSGCASAAGAWRGECEWTTGEVTEGVLVVSREGAGTFRGTYEDGDTGDPEITGSRFGSRLSFSWVRTVGCECGVECCTDVRWRFEGEVREDDLEGSAKATAATDGFMGDEFHPTDAASWGTGSCAYVRD
ncbi:MAG: hypothetical protein ACOZNI_29230 [Myxococcota bacterium]